jgi:drug/metabolite transporter (DMT)-like permease
MIGALLVGLGTLIEEIGSSVSKSAITRRIERPYTMGFATHVAGIIGLTAIGLLIPAHFFAPNFPGGFVFDPASLPTVLLRIVLEILQAHFSLRALVLAERSTFAFIRTLTIPLLLFVDIVLGYMISLYQMAGILFVVAGLFYLFKNHGIHKRGAWLTLFTALNAVATISLYKYNITHFNSVEVEQGIMSLAIVGYFFFMADRNKEKPIKHLFHPAERVQLITGCFAQLTLSFAYLYLPPSVATAGKRALSSLWALAVGAFYFHERRIFVKVITLLLVVVGIALLAIP